MRRAPWLVLVPTLAILASAAPGSAGNEVNQSRYILTASVGIATGNVLVSNFELVDHNVFSALCSDDDGCTVRMRLVEFGTVWGDASTLYYYTGSAWSSSWNPSPRHDADGSHAAQKADEVASFFSHCFLWDGESAEASSDNGPGFALVVTNEDDLSGAACTMTLID